MRRIEEESRDTREELLEDEEEGQKEKRDGWYIKESAQELSYTLLHTLLPVSFLLVLSCHQMPALMKREDCSETELQFKKGLEEAETRKNLIPFALFSSNCSPLPEFLFLSLFPLLCHAVTHSSVL